MSNGESYNEIKARIHSRVQFIRNLVNRASAVPHMTQDDLTVAEEAVSSVEYGERILFRSLEALHSKDADLAGDIAWAVDHLTAGTLLAASRATLSESSLNAAAYKRAEEARLARKNSQQERALGEAIEKVLAGRDPKMRGLAGKILIGVNKALAAAGEDEVSVHVVGRRLKNLRS